MRLSLVPILHSLYISPLSLSNSFAVSDIILLPIALHAIPSLYIFPPLPSYSSIGWPEGPLPSASRTPLCLQTTLSWCSIPPRLLALRLLNLNSLPYQPWLAARMCAAARRPMPRCISPILLPPTASAKQRRESAYMHASSPVATRYAPGRTVKRNEADSYRALGLHSR